jgi:hypothetical protein
LNFKQKIFKKNFSKTQNYIPRESLGEKTPNPKMMVMMMMMIIIIIIIIIIEKIKICTKQYSIKRLLAAYFPLLSFFG